MNLLCPACPALPCPALSCPAVRLTFITLWSEDVLEGVLPCSPFLLLCRGTRLWTTNVEIYILILGLELMSSVTLSKSPNLAEP